MAPILSYKSFNFMLGAIMIMFGFDGLVFIWINRVLSLSKNRRI